MYKYTPNALIPDSTHNRNYFMKIGVKRKLRKIISLASAQKTHMREKFNRLGEIPRNIGACTRAAWLFRCFLSVGISVYPQCRRCPFPFPLPSPRDGLRLLRSVLYIYVVFTARLYRRCRAAVRLPLSKTFIILLL